MQPFSSSSLKLIRGTIDQVDETAHITWVQPRVLSRGQIGDLSNRLSDWCKKLESVEQRIAPELLVSSWSDLVKSITLVFELFD